MSSILGLSECYQPEDGSFIIVKAAKYLARYIFMALPAHENSEGKTHQGVERNLAGKND